MPTCNELSRRCRDNQSGTTLATWCGFLPGKVERLLTQDQSPEQCRNPCLTQAMVALKLIDTVGSGIRRMFIEQRKRFFPLPDYVIEAEQQRVEVRITGRILGEQYTHALMQQPDLSLMDVFLLDKVQKRLPISTQDARALRARKLIEGRTPNLHVSAKVAQVMGEQAQHTLNKGLDSTYYRELVLQHLRNFIGHWGTGDLELTLRSMADLDAAKPFISAAYEGRALSGVT
jgi:ATP-dependent DNA helicase RecG